MRLLWYSNAPWAPTGYGSQTRQLLPRLRTAGHDIVAMGNWGHTAGLLDWQGIPVWPQGHASYSLDVADDIAGIVKPDHIITLYDVWPLRGAWKGQRVTSWTPIDHYPAPPDVLKWAREHRTVAMSRFGQDMLEQGGVKAHYAPHAISDQWRPSPSDVRARMKVPDDAFLVVINAANIGVTPPRKAWGEMLQAMAAFMGHRSDVYLYLHTDLIRPNGVVLPVLISALDLPSDRLRKVDLLGYRAGLIDDEELARIYSAADVLLATSKGEGFGLPVLESMACGTPAIVSDFSAQPEIVGESGWKVPVQPDWDHNQGAFFATPLIAGIFDALEQAYGEHGTEAAATRSAAAIARAAEYEADKVFAECWVPILAEMEAELAPTSTIVPRRQKRRRRK